MTQIATDKKFIWINGDWAICRPAAKAAPGPCVGGPRAGEIAVVYRPPVNAPVTRGAGKNLYPGVRAWSGVVKGVDLVHFIAIMTPF